MKLILAIVSKDDSSSVASGLTKAGFSATKLSTSGGFLKTGNTTFLIGTEDDLVEEAIEIIKKLSGRRTQQTTDIGLYNSADYVPAPVEVSLGGATVFVLDIEKFEKL